MINITAIKAFSDNYIWLLDDGVSAVVVDPGDAQPVIDQLQQKQLVLKQIIVTHHHFDHVDGIERLRRQVDNDIDVIYPANSPYQDGTKAVADGDNIELFQHHFKVLSVPGHTLDHVCYYSETLKVLFCGDTLFAGGCGRVFEGSNEQMHDSLQRLAQLPPDTKVYCAHEYTLDNLRFAITVDTNNVALQQRLKKTVQLRNSHISTLPSTIGDELATNPFLRCNSTEISRTVLKNNASMADSRTIFTVIRELKNNYK